MNAEQYLNEALGGNMNIGTLKPQAWHEIMEGYARHKLAEAQVASTNTKTGDVCPKCDYEYPHLYKDGHYKCDECGFVWVGQTPPVL